MEGILIVILCLIVFAFMYLFASWATGMRIKNHLGQTISTPEDLPNLISDARKLVDNKYKGKKELEKEFNEDMKKYVEPIERRISDITFKLSLDKVLPVSLVNPKLSVDELFKLNQLLQELIRQKMQLTDEIKKKYDRKIVDLN